jgi:hypothetical protein
MGFKSDLNLGFRSSLWRVSLGAHLCALYPIRVKCASACRSLTFKDLRPFLGKIPLYIFYKKVLTIEIQQRINGGKNDFRKNFRKKTIVNFFAY